MTVPIGDEARLRQDTQRALRFGFGGKHLRGLDTAFDACGMLDYMRHVLPLAVAVRLVEGDADFDYPVAQIPRLFGFA